MLTIQLLPESLLKSQVVWIDLPIPIKEKRLQRFFFRPIKELGGEEPRQVLFHALLSNFGQSFHAKIEPVKLFLVLLFENSDINVLPLCSTDISKKSVKSICQIRLNECHGSISFFS